MTARDFCFWLQGYLELSMHEEINAEQTLCIKRHLSMVFAHDIDPSMGNQEQQDALNHLHGTSTHPPGYKPRC